MLARKKQDQRKSASEEARKQAMWDERNRIRDEEEKAAASGVKPKSTQATLQDSIGVAVSESKWDRLMNGGGKKKKAPRIVVGRAHKVMTVIQMDDPWPGFSVMSVWSLSPARPSQ